MNSDPLLSCRIKIDRAIKHFNDLTAEIDAFKARNPYRIVPDEKSEPAIKIYRIHIAEEIPVEWSAHIGDILHNLKSALDSWATSIAIRCGATSNTEIKRTYFPIRGSEPDLSDADAMAFFKRVGPKIEKFIRRLQPYRGGKGDTLWRLNQLNIIDKHRRIIPAASNLSEVQAEIPATLLFSKQVFQPIFPVNPPFPLKEGDEVFRVAFFEAHFDANAHFIFEIAFSEGEIIDREPLMPTLSQFINFVQRFTSIFERRFF